MRYNDTVCVVLAAGKGTRMVSAKPKVLHELCGRPMLSYVLEAVGGQVKTVLTVVGYCSENVTSLAGSHGSESVLQEKQLGTGHAVVQVKDSIGSDIEWVLVLSGDVPLITEETISGLVETGRRSKAAATILSVRLESPGSYGVICRDEEGKVREIIEASDRDSSMCGSADINTGIYVFSKDALFAALDEIQDRNAQGEYYLTDVIKVMYGKGLKIMTHTVPEDERQNLMGINTREELAEASERLNRRIARSHMKKGVTIVNPATTFIGPDVRIGIDTVIEPFTVITGTVTIGSNCRIGPFAHIRTGTTLADKAEIGNFMEVKNSTVGSGTKAKHLSYLGDVTIEAKTNIGAGTIIANYDGRKKHKTRIGDNCFIGSGAILIAPLEIGDGTLVAAGAVVTKKTQVPPGSIMMGIPAKVYHTESVRSRNG